jgi:adenine-specific DNA methylase
LDVIKSMIPKEHPVVRRVVFELVRPARARMLERFLQQVFDHLQPGGSVLLFIHRREVTLTTGWRREVVATDREFRVVRLWPTTTHSQASF